jgi:hypothetical protein
MREIAWAHRTRGWAAKWLALVAMLTAIICGTGPAFAQTFNSGSTGADGAFNPTTSTTLTLPPDGVFNFTTINIPAGVTVRFARNAANTPVTLLASGNVTIAGTIDVSGSPGGSGVQGATNLVNNGGAGGPGGFDGGDGADGLASTTGGSGLGPGGGAGGVVTGGAGNGGGGGGFVVSGATGLSASGSSGTGGAGGGPYGTSALIPLIGGSGGGAGGAPFGHTGSGGGGGGGALLIASSGTITLTGTLLARGGSGTTSAGCCVPGTGGSGSGGAIRLIATTITGSGGSINVVGGVPTFGGSAGSGSIGRIRIEAYTNTATINYAQVPSIDKPGVVALPNAPTLTISAIAGVAAPASPTGTYATPDITLPAGTTNPMTIALAASNIPLGTTVTVTVKPLDGAASSATSTGLAGTLAASTATASLTIPTSQPSVISASATFTLASLPGAGPLFAQGEQVERIRVAAVLGGLPTTTYITRSGREVPADTPLDRQLVDGVRR